MDKKLILQLKEETGAGIMDAKRVLDETKGDYEAAKKVLLKKGLEKAGKKSDREIKAGLVWSYIHGGEQGGRIGVIVKVGCETDFVAKTADFTTLCKEVAMQVSAMDPKDVKALLKQEYIRDTSKNIEQLIKETIAKVGENIVVADFSRLEI
ncbi:elongation factor Ts [bacterium]|nr:elongation factor Ts [bacterium]